MPTSPRDIMLPRLDTPSLPPASVATSIAGATPAFWLGYRPALDGLRAIAVVAVMAVHPNLLAGGWLGVDVFFTLSGFLITVLLLQERASTGRIAFKAFYTRRALRLLPALTLFLAVWIVVLSVHFPDFVSLTLGNALAVALYVANWAKIAGYGLGVFAHTWSLAIEEQFYIVWPLLLALILPRRNGRLTAVLLVATAAAVAYRMALAHQGASHTRLYEGLDTHADSLLLGGALAAGVASGLLPCSRRGRLVTSVVGVCATITLAALFVVADQPRHGLLAGAITATATAGVIAASLIGAFPATLLSIRPLVELGRISYGIYLWHFPVFFYCGVLIRDASTPWHIHVARSAAAWVVTIVIAALSFHLMERPLLALKPARQRPLDRLAFLRASGSHG